MNEQCTMYNATIYASNNIKFTNLLDIPTEQYLNINKVVLPIKDENKESLVICLGFIYENFTNLKKLKFAIEQEIGEVISNFNSLEDVTIDKNGPLQIINFLITDKYRNCLTNYLHDFFASIITDKIALLQKLSSVKVCFGNKYIRQKSLSPFSHKGNTAYVYKNNMTVFNFDDNLIIPLNVTKLNIVNAECYSQKILSSLEVGLTDLNITINENEIKILNSINLPPTVTKFNMSIYVLEDLFMDFDNQAFNEHIAKCVKIKNKTRKIIKLPHNCEFNINIEKMSISKPLFRNEPLSSNKYIKSFLETKYLFDDNTN